MAKLPDKYKGQSFAKISTNIQKNYQDRYDPISQRGLMNEMTALRQEQDYIKAKQEIKEGLKAMLANPQAQQTQQPGVEVPQQSISTNQGINVDTPQQPNPAFNHAASQSYNQQFANGGWIEANEYIADPIDMSGFNQQFLNNQSLIDVARQNNINQNVGIGGLPQTQSQVPSTGVAPQQNNLLRYAPLAGNLFNIISARKPQPVQNSMTRTSINENLATGVTPRQTQFSNIDFGSIERGINEQARGFTGNNLNTSGGNAGAFMANELGNQGNIMSAIAGARLQQQQGDQRTQGLNAQEQARIDQFKQSQNQSRAQIQGQNIGLDMQMNDLNARDLGAFNSAKSANVNALFSNLGEIGREQDLMDMVSNSMGYNSFGQYMQSLTPEHQKGIFDLIIKSRNK